LTVAAKESVMTSILAEQNTSPKKDARSDQTRKAHLIGGGIGSLAAAAFMIRDTDMSGQNITIYEAMSLLGGSLDGGGNPHDGYTLRGGRMLTTDNYECTWDLFQTIPSLTNSNVSVFDQTKAFNRANTPDSHARLVDENRHRLAVLSMGFSMADRLELFKLVEIDEAKLGNSRVTDWLSPAFFKTEFWFMWATTFAFQPWHSAVEFRRYLHRFMLEFTRIETLAGVKRTEFNQYDSLVQPLVAWLTAFGVTFVPDCRVDDIVLSDTDGMIAVEALHLTRNGQSETVSVSDHDLVFFQNGSMTDASSFGSMTRAPEKLTKADSGGWTLWEKIAARHPEFGSPAVFNSSIPETYWESFTVTLDNAHFFDAMEKFTGNVAGTGGLVTLRDSNWLMSVVLAHQPHFARQPAHVKVFWGYALHPDRVGNFVPKPMSECSGEEVLHELCGHLNFDMGVMAGGICIPCRMPYITSMFMPRKVGDRPLPVPRISQNLAFVSQFVELPEDVVFTVEYSIRAAQTAVYELLKVERPVPPVLHHDRSIQVKIAAAIKAFA
jgi:oleate hydratase